DTHAPASGAPRHPSLHLSIKVLRRSIESAQYTSRAFAEACRLAGVRQSMSAIGSSADNAAAESFNATFKRETLKGRKGWSNEREARLDAFRWLHRYNTRRRHSRLGQRSPLAYEDAFHTTSTTLTRAA
ncbi:integrase core domain-containing protein, partial [Streptomyces sp. NPDC056154]|uniref:integrase core domain-containing protein n=1 Tax=unclassified Streptomyces TaxID=2593676 RepID=UPI0035DF3AB8